MPAYRHGLELPLVDQVQEQSFGGVVQVVAQAQLGGAQLVGARVQNATPQPRAKAAVSF